MSNYRPDQFLANVLQVPWSILDVFDDPEDKLNAFNLLFNKLFFISYILLGIIYSCPEGKGTGGL